MVVSRITHTFTENAQNSWLLCAASRMPLSLLLLVISSVKAQLPYNPTYLLRPSKNNGAYIYILEPVSPGYNRGRLLAVDTSVSLDSNNISALTISSSLPFLEIDPSAAYTSVLDPQGSIIIYSGNCSRGVTGSTVWRFTPNTGNATGPWDRQSYQTQEVGKKAMLSGTKYLSGAIQFSATGMKADSSFYIFGGMCSSSNSTLQQWTSAATYSNSLLKLHASEISLTTQEDPQPIPEAGFSMTALSPNYSNGSDTLTQQQDFLLLGGQSGTAFINMSEVALLSLPQENWMYESVNTPISTSTIEPRSGHTATLTADGSKVVIIGGWVGDISMPASPQLAVLDIGLGYGGQGDWTWSIPSSSNFPFSHSGVYGHGAILLDDEVIFVAGGYQIPSASPGRKRAVQTRNTENFFYNISSQQWLSKYNPTQLSPTANITENQSRPLTSKADKIGLGVGLSLGLLGITLALLGCFFIRRTRRRRDRGRNEADKIGNTTNIAYVQQEQPYQDTDEEVKEEIVHEVPVASLWDRRQHTRDSWTWIPGKEGDNGVDDGWGTTGAREAERTGLDVDIPSPRRGLRRSMYGSTGRNGNRVVAVLDDDPPTGYGNMYAIEERSEEESSSSSRKVSSIQPHPRPHSALIDPFSDPVLTSVAHLGERQYTIPRKPLPMTQHFIGTRPEATHASPTTQHQHDVSAWLRDWAAPDTLLPHGPSNSLPKSGRSSPAKSNRTSSMISERSLQTLQSAIIPNVSPIQVRENRRSIRYYFPGLFNGFAGSISVASSSPSRSTYAENNSRPNTSGRRESNNRPDTSNNQDTSRPPLISIKTTDADSFTTAQSNISSMHRYESDTLLGSPSPPYYKFNTIVEPDTEPTFTRCISPALSGIGHSHSRGRMDDFVGNMRRIVSPRALNFAGERRSEERRINGHNSVSSNISINGGASYTFAPATGPEEIFALPVEGDLFPENTSPSSARNFDMQRGVSDGAALPRPRRDTREWNTASSSSSPPEPFLYRSALNTPVPTPVLNKADVLNLSRTLSPSSVAQAIRAERRRSGRSAVSGRSGRNSVISGTSGESEGDPEWDVEAAVEEKVVHQVISAVPRERLKVVNSDPVVGRWESYGSGEGSDVTGKEERYVA